MQGVKALYQFALDGGSWRTAWALTLLEDPYDRPRFAGEESELATVTGFLRAQDDLDERIKKSQPRSGTSPRLPREEDEGSLEDAAPAGKGGKNGGRGRPKKKDP